MAKEVKCVLCSEPFNSGETLRKHLVELHNIPRGDPIMERYVRLRFSKREFDDKTFETMMKLLKNLKQKAAKYTLQREKIKLDSQRVRHMFSDYEKFNEANSVSSDPEAIESERINRSSAVTWFLYYYNIYINNDIKNFAESEGRNIAILYTQEECQAVKCARVKIEQKENVELDFNGTMKIYGGIASPLEIFITLSKVLLKSFFTGLRKSQNSCQILFQITAEFSKTEEKDDDFAYEDDFTTTNEYFEDCEERRTTREYSTSVSGHVLNIKRHLNDGFGNLISKVINTFNVVGSNWAVRRITNLNISVLYDINSFTSLSRLVKGKLPIAADTLEEQDDEIRIDSKKFEALFKIGYEQMQIQQSSREKVTRMMNGQIGGNSKKTEHFPPLSAEDLECVKTFSKQTLILMKSMKQQQQHQYRPQEQKTQNLKTSSKTTKSKQLAQPPALPSTPFSFVEEEDEGTESFPLKITDAAKQSQPPKAPKKTHHSKFAGKPNLAKRKLALGEGEVKERSGAFGVLKNFVAEYPYDSQLNAQKKKCKKSETCTTSRGAKASTSRIKFSSSHNKKGFFTNQKKKKAPIPPKTVETIDLTDGEEEEEDNPEELSQLNADMIDDAIIDDGTDDASFYNRINKSLPKTQYTRIVGDPEVQKQEQNRFKPTSDDSDSEEDMGQPLNFRDGEVPLDDDDDEDRILDKDDDGSDLDEGVKLIRMKDGTTKMFCSGDQKDISEKLRNNIRQKLAKSKKEQIVEFELDVDEPMFAKLKQEENCFISTILGCVAMLVYKTQQRSNFEKGETIDKADLQRLGVLKYPYRLIKNLGPSTIGVESLPERLFEKDFVYPSIDEDNIADKLTQIESELNNHGIDISFNLYLLAEDRVHTKVISGNTVTSVNRLTSSVIIAQQSKTNKPRSHNTAFNILLTEEGEGTQFHCAAVLDIGKFIYHNDERFQYEKGPDRLANVINTSKDCLSEDIIGSDVKVSTAKSRRSQFAARTWQNVHNCNACMTGFLKKDRFENHISNCVGGHVSSMVFETIPHIEHFESREFPNTLLCPIVASFDTEACQSKDITRRIAKDGSVYKSDARKYAEMILCGVVATVIVRPNRNNDYTFYKDTSMSDEDMMDYSTVPFPIRRHVEVEDIANLSQSLDNFRMSMNAFMELKSRILKMHVEISENPTLKDQAKEELNVTNTLLSKRRLEASKRFGVFFMQFFQILMEATKKEVAVRSKKTLKMTWQERAMMLDEVLNTSDAIFEDGVLYFVEKPKEDTNSKTETCFQKIHVNTENSVTVAKDFNCVICNQKLDPIYLQNLKKYYQAKIANGKAHQTGICGRTKDDENDLDEDDDDYEMLIGNEIVRVGGSEQPNDFNKETPRSPHVHIWRGRNMWQVKEKLLMLFFSQINRLKQELLVKAYRSKKVYIEQNNLESISDIDAETSKKLSNSAFETVIADYKIENSDSFVMNMMWDEWQFTEPYTAEKREQLIDCLYNFVESIATLEQFGKVFDNDCAPISLQCKSAKEFACQDAVKTYFSKNSAAEDQHEEKSKEYRTKLKPLSNKKNRVFWFIDQKAYEDIGENVLRMTSLLLDGETCKAENYTPKTIFERIRSIEIRDINTFEDDKRTQEEIQFDFFNQRLDVLKHRLFHSFVKMYPEFEFELRFFFNGQVIGENNLNKMINVYLDSIVIHHHHYFPEMKPIGHAHESCNIVTYTKGVPTPHIYVHNLTNYDSDFILKMIPPDIMAHKGRNTERQWSVISPDGNKHKIKLLMTPFGTFSDSMNFFASSLATMASQMSERDVEQLYQLHLSYFQRSKRFKQILKLRETEGTPFSLDFFKDHFKGKLIFPYEDMDDIDWVNKMSDNLPSIEVFKQNKLGKGEITDEQYASMAKIYKFFGCKNMSDLLHIYTLEDGMLLAIIMSNTFQDMYDALGLDPTNFASTAKYSYIACKRLMNLNMQTIPNGRVFNCITEMKRAGFSLVKKQVGIASPLNEHIQKCQYSPDCEICRPFVKVIHDAKDIQEICEETNRVVEECKIKLKRIQEDLRDEMDETGAAGNSDLIEVADQLTRFYENLKIRETQCQYEDPDSLKEFTEYIAVLQSCIFYYDESNQYGRALKQTLPVGNYVWVKTAKPKDLVEILEKQTLELKKNRNARVVDFYACVNMELNENHCTSADIQREEEFNLLVRNETPNVFNYTEKMLRVKRKEYSRSPGKFVTIPTYKKLISGTKPLYSYWIHSAIVKMALKNGWKITKVHNVLTFTSQRVCEAYIQFNQDERMRYTLLNREFMGLFHKLMNNGFYGWFCRAVEKYKQTDLLFSSQTSYEHFERCSEALCSNKTLQERAAIIMTNNPHDSQEDKVEKITEIFQKQIDLARKKISTLENVFNNTEDEQAHRVTKGKLKALEKYVATAKVSCSETIAMFEIDEAVKKLELKRKREELESQGKKMFEISKGQKPVNKNNVKSRDEVVQSALRGKSNKNTCVVLFNTGDEGIQSVCFGMVSSQRNSIVMRSKNDVAIAVLAHAKARIGEFFRLLNNCLPSRTSGMSVKLLMSDTDSVACQSTYSILMRRHPKTKQLAFRSEEDKKNVLSSLGSDKMKRHIETFFCCSQEMCRIVDAAHYEEDAVYFDKSRKKVVGLYTDEAPLPKLITSFQCVGPKNYQFKMVKDIKKATVTVSKAKHKGVPKSQEVTEEDYSKLLVTWDRQYDQTRAIKGYSLQDRRNAFQKLDKQLADELHDFVETQKANKELEGRKPPKKSKLEPKVVKNSVYLEEIDAKQYLSYSFYTTQLGVYLTKVQKRLGVAPSDKVIFPRYSFGAYSLGSRFADAVKKFNKNKSYNELFDKTHLFNLYAMETEFLQSMPRYYPNGVEANRLVKLEEEIDYNVCSSYLESQIQKFEKKMAETKLSEDTKNELDRNVAGESDIEE